MKISVVMCTFNGERYLKEQLRSIAGQTRLPDELVVVDDRSSDNTWSILQDFAAGSPFPTIASRNETNVGVAANFAAAARKATGDVIFLCDQDDVWVSTKIAIVTASFERIPNLGLVITDADIVDERLRNMGQTLWQSFLHGASDVKAFENDPFSFLLTRRNTVTGAAAAFSKKVIDAAVPFPSEMAVIHDAWFGLIASAISQVKTEPEKLLKYRQHATQVVGVRKHRQTVAKAHYLAHYRQLIALRDRLSSRDDVIDKSYLILLNGYIEHLKARIELPANQYRRALFVGSELLTGRYHRYSNGSRSALKDILKGE
jgi:glycosyltransferase involved in cell wall biosynthesis